MVNVLTSAGPVRTTRDGVSKKGNSAFQARTTRVTRKVEAVTEEAKKVISWRSSPSVRGRRKRAVSVLCVVVRLTLGVV